VINIVIYPLQFSRNSFISFKRIQTGLKVTRRNRSFQRSRKANGFTISIAQKFRFYGLINDCTVC